MGEVIIRVQHNLIGPPGATSDDVTVVESHPVALAQCEQFFSSRPSLKRIATDDTAGSVREIVQAADRKRAAIASKRAAQIYGGQILREHLEDDPENYTRFVLLAPAREAVPDASGQNFSGFQARARSRRPVLRAGTFRATKNQFDES